jgi:uncharacterized iron-regulated membrane protein
MLTDKFIFRIHRILGLTAGLFILMLTLTGSILVFDSQVDAWLNPEITKVVPDMAADATRQSTDALLTVVHRQYPTATIHTLQLYTAETDRAIRVELTEKDQRTSVYLNPYTGTILGTRNPESTFVHEVRELHESLLWEPYGGYIMGLVGLCLLGSVLTGTWYYRKSLLRILRVGVRWNKPRRIVYADIHNYLGVTTLLFMTLMSATGIFFHWEMIERAFGDGPEPAQAQVTIPTITNVDTYLNQSQQALPGFVAEVISFPEAAGEPLVVRGNTPESSRLWGALTANKPTCSGPMKPMPNIKWNTCLKNFILAGLGD